MSSAKPRATKTRMCERIEELKGIAEKRLQSSELAIKISRNYRQLLNKNTLISIYNPAITASKLTFIALITIRICNRRACTDEKFLLFTKLYIRKLTFLYSTCCLANRCILCFNYVYFYSPPLLHQLTHALSAIFIRH